MAVPPVIVAAPPVRAAGVDVRVRGLSHRYPGGEGRASGPLLVLDDLDLDLAAGGHLALTGPSGAGKSTLLALLGGLEAPQTGEVRVGEADLRGLTRRDLARFRRETIGFVFQHYGLVEVLSARENVALALALAGVPARRRAARSLALLDRVGLADRAGHRPAALSGGERQRVAIARALANHPRLLLCDEPTGNLDGEAAELVLGLLEEESAREGATLIVVTHSEAVAERAAERRRLLAGRWAS